MRQALMAVAVLGVLLACGTAAVAPDGGGPPDGGGEATLDAGAPGDAGAVDAGGAPDAGPASSRGHGGVPCLRRGSVSTTAGTKAYCVAKVGPVEFKVIEPDDVTTNPAPLRLGVYLHGDGARTYTNDTAPRLQAPWTTSHHVLYVSALAPNTCAWWTKPSVNPCDAGVTTADKDLDGENAAALEAVVQAVRAGWDVLDSPVLMGGSSGGSIFLTGSYLPRYGAARQGTWALNCGGERPWDALPFGPGGGLRLSFTWGDQDFLAPDVTDAVGYFRDAGFPVEEKVVPGATHCAFDHLGRTTEVWATP